MLSTFARAAARRARWVQPIAPQSVIGVCGEDALHELVRRWSGGLAGGDRESDVDDRVSGRTVSPITRALWEKRQRMDAALKLEAEGAVAHKEQTVFEPKVPEFMSVTFPFSEDPVLVEQYRSPWGYVRLGRLLEDLDSLAGNIAHAHCDDGDVTTPPPLLVTAGVEKITLKRPMRLDSDMVLRGRVVWVGSSSMDIRMEVVDAAGRECLVSHFLFVARNPFTQTSQRVNPLRVESAEDREMFEERGQWAAARKARAQAQRGDASVVGKGEEGAAERRERWIADIMDKSQVAQDMPALVPSGWVWAHDTAHENILMCQPQQRNMAGRIFGGFLMRRAFELAFSTCYAFAGTRPAFLLVDDITFRRPVDVGDLLRLKSHVLHVEHKYNPGPPWLGAQTASHAVVHVAVTAFVVQPEKPSSHVTNTFQFRFAVDNNAKPLKAVLPSSFAEASEMYGAFVQHAHD